MALDRQSPARYDLAAKLTVAGAENVTRVDEINAQIAKLEAE